MLLFGVLMVMMMIWRPRGPVRTSRSGVALRKESRHDRQHLRVEHLMMHFGGIKALNDVNLEVERGRSPP